MTSCVARSSRPPCFTFLDYTFSLRPPTPHRLGHLQVRFASVASLAKRQRPSAQSAPTTSPLSRPNILNQPSPSSPSSSASASASPPPSVAKSTQPLIIYEGPPQQRPSVSWFLFGSFSFIGLVTGFNLSQHLAWPLWSLEEAALVEPKKRYIVGFFVASLSVSIASIFKYVPTHNIIRMTLIEDPSRGPMLKILTATRPIFPRGFFRTSVRPAIAQDHGKREFTAPLENVVRRKGSAVAQGWVSERTKGMEKRSIAIDIGGDAYILEGSGVKAPVRASMSWAGYALSYFTWRFIRGSPSAPYFWSRQAFDELIPQASQGAKRR